MLTLCGPVLRRPPRPPILPPRCEALSAAASDASHVTQSPLQTNARRQSAGRIPVAAMLRLQRGRASPGTRSTMMPGNGFAGLDPCLVNYCWLACARTLFDNRILFGTPATMPVWVTQGPCRVSGRTQNRITKRSQFGPLFSIQRSKRKPNSNRRGDAEGPHEPFRRAMMQRNVTRCDTKSRQRLCRPPTPGDAGRTQFAAQTCLRRVPSHTLPKNHLTFSFDSTNYLVCGHRARPSRTRNWRS
jgi:hypothetical protein